MKKHILILILPVVLFSTPLVTNVRFSQKGDIIHIYYDLNATGGKFNVKLDLSTDGGKTFTIVPKSVSGDIGKGVKPGENKHIVWYASRDYKTLTGTNFVFRVTAEGKGLIYLRTNSKGYKEYKNTKDGSILIYIPAGEFTMGSNHGDSDEKPVHKVYLDGYYIGKYEVTNRQYKKFCDATGYPYPTPDPGFPGMDNYFENYPDYPVVNETWYGAVAYCKWAGLRLPTEAEWEKAARGTDGRKYPWGNSESGTNKANYWIGDNGQDDSYHYTSPVGSFPRGISPYGCYDMAGNAFEWCSDGYDANYYRHSPYKNPKGPASDSFRVNRGGSWRFSVWEIRCSFRNWPAPDYRRKDFGFRVARSP